MPFTTSRIELPESPVSPADAPIYLKSIVEWTRRFFYDVAEESRNSISFMMIFDRESISYLMPCLEEMEDNGIFDKVESRVSRLDTSHIIDHGLFGYQLSWKVFNVNYWYELFIENPGRDLLERLLDAIDAILESILSGVPGGGAIIELKEAIRNAVALVAEAKE